MEGGTLRQWRVRFYVLCGGGQTVMTASWQSAAGPQPPATPPLCHPAYHTGHRLLKSAHYAKKRGVQPTLPFFACYDCAVVTDEYRRTGVGHGRECPVDRMKRAMANGGGVHLPHVSLQQGDIRRWRAGRCDSRRVVTGRGCFAAVQHDNSVCGRPYPPALCSGSGRKTVLIGLFHARLAGCLPPLPRMGGGPLGGGVASRSDAGGEGPRRRTPARLPTGNGETDHEVGHMPRICHAEPPRSIRPTPPAVLSAMHPVKQATAISEQQEGTVPGGAVCAPRCWRRSR